MRILSLLAPSLLLAASDVVAQTSTSTTSSESSSTSSTAEDAAATTAAAAETVDPDAWVSILSNGDFTTITPVTTTIDGTVTVIDAAPDDATDLVRTKTINGRLTTITNSAVIATATSSSGAGAFTICSNTDGENAPFCEVAGGEPLVIGNTYYIKWDPTFYSENTTVEITGDYINSTTGEVDTQAFSSGTRESAWGFWAYTAESSILRSGDGSNVTISLNIIAIASDSSTPSTASGPQIIVKKQESVQSIQPEPSYNKTALTIALPVCLGALIFIVGGLFFWNRKTRKIDIKNVMGHGKKGYGISKSKFQRLARGSGRGRGGGNRNDIPLMDMQGQSVYRDDPYSDNPGGARSRTPGQQQQGEQFRFNLGPGAGRNAFREEIARQNRDKLA